MVNRRFPNHFAVIALLMSMAPTASLAAWFNHDVSEKPVRSIISKPLPTTTSSIGASASVTYKALSDALNTAVPSTFHADGRQQVCADLNELVQQTVQRRVGGDVGRFLGNVARIVTQVVTVNQVRHVCQDVDYQVQVNRTGPVTVSGAANKVNVLTTVAIAGQAGFSGDLAKAVKLDKKNFRGGIEMAADISLDVDDHWCPHLQATPSFRWTDKAQLEIAHNVWLGIEGQVGDKIKDQMTDAISKVQSSLKCESVTTAVRNVWHQYSLPIALPYFPGATAFVNFTPTSMGFSGISYGTSDLRLALSVDALTEVTTESPRPSNPGGDLPSLKRIPSSSDKIALALPIKIGYDSATAAAQAFVKGRTFGSDTPLGHVKVIVTDVEVYPSAGKLALGMHFSASTGHQIFDTKGTVYLLAEPTLDANRQTVTLKNVSFTTVLDNALWATFSAVFNGQIKASIEQNAVYDLKPKIAELKSQVQSQLAAVAAKQKIGLALKPDFIGLRAIELEDKTLDIVVELDGMADLLVNTISIPPLS